MAQPAASVIFTTYNQPDWLEKVLVGFGAQTVTDFEILVADDGSRDDTRERIAALASMLPVPVRHLWQPDDGFRKCEAMNMAIEESRADYLVFTDGDCIPRRDFLARHLSLREPGRFLSGGYHKLPMDTSLAIGADDIRDGRCFDPAWLKRHGMPNSRRNLKISVNGVAAVVLDRLSPARASWNGHNASGWKRDVLAVNGFDERMKYGGQDREFGERLENAGILGKRVRYRAIVLHLDHARGYDRPESIARNLEIREQTRRQRITWAEQGLQKPPRKAS